MRSLLGLFQWMWGKTVAHWQAVGTVATVSLVAGAIMWFLNSRKKIHETALFIEQKKEVKARNDEREKKEKCDAIRHVYCDQFWKVKRSGVEVRDLDHLLELVPLRIPYEEVMRTEAYGLVLHGKYRGGAPIIEQEKKSKSKYAI